MGRSWKIRLGLTESDGSSNDWNKHRQQKFLNFSFSPSKIGFTPRTTPLTLTTIIGLLLLNYAREAKVLFLN